MFKIVVLLTTFVETMMHHDAQKPRVDNIILKKLQDK